MDKLIDKLPTDNQENPKFNIEMSTRGQELMKLINKIAYLNRGLSKGGTSVGLIDSGLDNTPTANESTENLISLEDHPQPREISLDIRWKEKGTSNSLRIICSAYLSKEFLHTEPSTEAPLSKFSIYLRRHGNVPWILPNSDNPVTNTNETNPRYRESLTDNQNESFGVELSIEGDHVPKVIQGKAVGTEFGIVQEYQNYPMATEFGLKFVDRTLEIGNAILNNTLEDLKQSGDDYQKIADEWWKENSKLQTESGFRGVLEQYKNED